VNLYGIQFCDIHNTATQHGGVKRSPVHGTTHTMQGPQQDQDKDRGSFLQQFISPDDG
jgi:hypothetical protein